MDKKVFVVLIISLLTSISVFLQWIGIWTGTIVMESAIEGFKYYLYSFQIADMWMVLSGVIASVMIFAKSSLYVIPSVALGSSMVFFGLYSNMYDILTKEIYNISIEGIIGKAIGIYNIVFGILIIILITIDMKNMMKKKE